MSTPSFGKENTLSSRSRGKEFNSGATKKSARTFGANITNQEKNKKGLAVKTPAIQQRKGLSVRSNNINKTQPTKKMQQVIYFLREN